MSFRLKKKRFWKKIRHLLWAWEPLWNFVSFLLARYLQLVYRTSQWHSVGDQAFREEIHRHPILCCIWHHRLLMIPFMWKWSEKKMAVLVSPSPIGVLTRLSFARLGIDSVEGSSTRSPVSGYRTLLKRLRQGDSIGIAPDGPRGPSQIAKMGIVHLAAQSGVPLIPVSLALSRYKTIKTWDQMRWPLPFSKGVFVYGDPLRIPHESKKSLEHWRRVLDEKMTELDAIADQLLTK